MQIKTILVSNICSTIYFCLTITRCFLLTYCEMHLCGKFVSFLYGIFSLERRAQKMKHTDLNYIPFQIITTFKKYICDADFFTLDSHSHEVRRVLLRCGVQTAWCLILVPAQWSLSSRYYYIVGLAQIFWRDVCHFWLMRMRIYETVYGKSYPYPIMSVYSRDGKFHAASCGSLYELLILCLVSLCTLIS